MRYPRLAAIALFLAHLPAHGALPPGAPSPEFTTLAAKAGKPFNFTLQAARRNGPVILYFFPAAFTPGCTVEAHDFAEAMPQFRKLGATVLGLAGDDIIKLSKFSVEECRKKFPVGVATAEIIRAYDVALPMAARSNRTSYLITPDGRIQFVWSNADYRDHVPKLLEALRNWNRRRR